jgi:hypothetical protein
MEQFVFAIAEHVARAIAQVEERSHQFDFIRPYPLGSFVSHLLNGKRDARNGDSMEPLEIMGNYTKSGERIKS